MDFNTLIANPTPELFDENRELFDEKPVAQEYMVFWQFPITAESPRQAAEIAQLLISQPDMLTGVFDVVSEDGTEHRVDVSLSEEAELEQDAEFFDFDIYIDAQDEVHAMGC